MMLNSQKFLLLVFGILCLTSCDSENKKTETATEGANPAQTPPSILDQQGQTDVKEVETRWVVSNSVDPLDDSEKSTAKGSFFDTENGPYMANVEFSCFRQGNQSRFEFAANFTDYNGNPIVLQVPEGKAQIDVRIGSSSPQRYVFGYKTEFYGAYRPYNNAIKTIIERGRFIPQYFQGMDKSNRIVIKPYLSNSSPTFILEFDKNAQSIFSLCRSQFETPKKDQSQEPQVDVTIMSAK
jgi:hypothetical protein